MLSPFGFSPLSLWWGVSCVGLGWWLGLNHDRMKVKKKVLFSYSKIPKYVAMPCPWHTLPTWLWLIFPRLGNPLVMALWVSPPGPSSVPGGDSLTAGATSPSLVPTYGCSPWGCPHTWLRPGFSQEEQLCRWRSKQQCLRCGVLHQRRSYRDSQCKVKTATGLWHTGQHKHNLSWSFQMGLTFFPAHPCPGRCCACSGITWKSELHRGRVQAQNWHELQRKHLGSSTGMWLCHPHSH